MKIRSGFVSNSSSSSFIIGFVKEPETEEELRDFMFGTTKHVIHPYDNMMCDTGMIAVEVFQDIKYELRKKIEDRDTAVEEMLEGHMPGFPYSSDKKYDDKTRPYWYCREPTEDGRSSGCAAYLKCDENGKGPEICPRCGHKVNYSRACKYYETDWERLEADRRKIAAEIWDNFVEGNPNITVFFEVEYSDDTSWGNMMEHGDIFAAIPHIRISKH